MVPLKNGDLLAQDQGAAAIGVKKGFLCQAGIKGEEMVEDGPGQLAAALQPLGTGGEDCAGLGELRREAPLWGEEVYANAHNGILQAAGLQVQGGLGEDAADLFGRGRKRR